MRKRDSPTNGWDSWVSVLGVFKLDHLQSVKLILFSNISTFLPFILGGPISYYPRERRQGSSRGWKEENGIHSKVTETQGFLYLEHSNWTICSLLTWSCPQNFPPFYSSYWKVQFLITSERGSKEAAGAGNGKMGFTQKRLRHRGFCTWGIQIGSFAVC